MNRIRHSDDPPFLGWRAAVALMTSALGALILLVVYMGLSSRGFTAKITTPMVSASDTKSIRFECRDNTVFKPDLDELADQTSSAMHACLGSASAFACEQTFARKPVRNAYYSTKPLLLLCPGDSRPVVGVQLQQVPGSRGESMLELQDQGSLFRRELAQFDRSHVHVFFLVRDDSFEVFQLARKIARKAGFRVGWEPFQRSDPLTFGGCANQPSGLRELPQ